MNATFNQYFQGAPDIISLDTEGFDLAILESLDFKKWRPKIFCIETITYTDKKTEKKINAVSDFIQKQGYMIYADTYINTIYIDIKTWGLRQ